MTAQAVPRSSFRVLRSALAVLLFAVPAGAQDATTLFRDAEERLVTADRVEIRSRITSSGAIAAELSGSLVLEAGNKATLRYTGTFAGERVDLHLVSDGLRMRGGNGVQRFDEPTPHALNEALVIGLMRMGTLHNLAMLTGGAPPDRASGGVTDWVQAVDAEFVVDEHVGTRAVDFRIVVAGEPAGEVTMDFDAAGRVPTRRRQTGQFPEGPMHVTESYKVVDP